MTSACSLGGGGGGGGNGPSQKPIESYCPHLPSKTFSPGVTITGSAFYEFRSNGNGPVSDSVHTFTPSPTTNGTVYQITINGTAISSTCAAPCTAASAVTGLTSAVSANNSLPVTASGTSTLILTPKSEGDTITYSALSNLTDTPDSSASPAVIHADPKPIRYAEVRVVNSGGTLANCAETDGNGAFTVQVPSDGGAYTIYVMARSNNANNTAYVMNNPTDNVPWSISTSVTASGSPTVRLIAKATGDLMGGAFNILDQIYNAQNYMRTQTANCNQSSSANYYPDCDPFVSAPIVNTYWSPGVTPAIYEGSTGGISYYGTPNGYESFRGLYILGGINGDTDNADMDHFDNSVIVHEYGHFIEYNFGRMDSPGGSHSGNAIIDSRLAWGEGWADFFQGVILGTGVYRDTYGHVGCSGSNAQGLPGCTGISFNEDLNLNPSTCAGTCHDVPTAAGEGDFREFSVARLMYQVAKSSGTSKFSEIWTILHGPANGMKVVADRFKGIGRVHKIQQAITGHADWSALRTTEKQAGDLSGYGTPFSSSGCSSTSQAMAINWDYLKDDGSFATSDQFRNNDFYYYSHAGGALSVGLSWSGSSVADLDIYIYPQGYVYGDTKGWSGASNATTTATSGSESVAVNVPAGLYMINVMAYTGGYPYGSNGTYNTTYNLTVNGAPVCPTP